jgi:23S rRNA pseudouridine2605 synthase
VSEAPSLPPKKIRIGKLLARAGLVPRRGAATFLEEHRVEIDGKQINELHYAIDEASLGDIHLTVDGRTVELAAANHIILLHKPKGVVCSHKSQRIGGKTLKTIFDLLPSQYRTWFFAGRLDVSSSGLMVLSNDGDHIFHLSHPKHGVLKKYFVRTSRPLSEAEIARAVKGVMDKAERLRFEKVISQGKPAHYEIHLKEGKNREIRRLLERLGVFARELKRTELGPYLLGDIPVGEFRQMQPIICLDAASPAEP